MTTARLVCVAGAMAMLAGAALGQADKPLSGPTVKPDRPAGLGGQFAEGKGDRKGPMADSVPMRLYSQAIDKLRGDEAPEGLRLSPEQGLQIRQIETNFKNTMQDYVRRTRQQNTAKRPAGDGEKEPMTPENERQRMQEAMRNAPNPTDAQVKIYALLSPAQQKFVDGEVAKGQAELDKRRSEEYMQRQLQKKKGEPGVVPPAGGVPEGRERARRIIERLQQLPPEERDQLLRRIEEELDRRATAGKGPRRPGGGDRKPPPKIDEVKVPPPDKP